LNSGQRAVIALEIEPLLAKESKVRQRLSKGPGVKVVKLLTTSKNTTKAAAQAAKLTGTNRSYVATAKKIKADAPDLLKKIKSGKTTIQDAKREISRRASHLFESPQNLAHRVRTFVYQNRLKQTI